MNRFVQRLRRTRIAARARPRAGNLRALKSAHPVRGLTVKPKQRIVVVASRSASSARTSAHLSFAKTLRGHKSRRVTMLQDHPHAIHFKHILYFGEGQASMFVSSQANTLKTSQEQSSWIPRMKTNIALNRV
jgi:hypothetical protein